MREILFRGKRVDNGEWIEGDLLNYLGWGKVHIAQNYKGAGGQEVVSKTVGQYTGLTDKNGKKIFEGDIVEVSRYKEKDLVCFGEHDISCCGCCYSYHHTIGFYLTNDNSTNVFAEEESWSDLEIIGNIHDNPELLKEVNE